MKYTTLGNGLYLVSYPVTPNLPLTPVCTNHIFLIDRSGSMYGTLSSLLSDLKTKLRQVASGDTVTIGWFSGEGQHNFSLKGFKISSSADYNVLDKALDNMNSTIGTTCFSEILSDVEMVVKDLSIFSQDFSLCLFTDGYPVVSNYNREVEKIFSAISKISGSINSALLVGYGDYYNKVLMADMAQKFGGALIHSSALPNFMLSLSSFLENAKGSIKHAKKLDTKSDLVFSINGNTINVLEQDSNNEVKFPLSAGMNAIYALSSTVPAKAKKINDLTSDSDMIMAAYAASYLLLQRTKTDKALEILGALGDKKLIDGANNAFTNSEYGRVEELIKLAAVSPSFRFLGGRDTNYLPKADAFCLLDVLNLLEDGSVFYPTHSGFKYKRIGKPQKTADGYPKFEPKPNATVPFGSLVWNDSKLNLSIMATIPGTVKLMEKDGKKPEDVGLAQIYPTKIYRNYTIVKDGFLNVDSIPASIGTPETFKTLVDNGVIDSGDLWNPLSVYTLHLDRIPIMNRKIASSSNVSATELCKKAYEELCLKAKIKALKWLKDEEFPSETLSTGLSAEQQEFLKANGIDKNGVFSPPKITEDATDFYMCKTFDIKIKSLSSLPKVEASIQKIESGKKPTPSEHLVYSGIELYNKERHIFDRKSPTFKRAWFDDTISNLTKEMKELRQDIQKTKFSIILGKQWFSEFNSRDNATLNIGDNIFTLELGEEKVNY